MLAKIWQSPGTFYIICTSCHIKNLPVLKCITVSDKWNCFLFCFRGTYDILVTKDSQTRCVGQYDSHGSFGELALMYNTPRAATIVATSEGSLWGLVSRE